MTYDTLATARALADACLEARPAEAILLIQAAGIVGLTVVSIRLLD